MIMSACIVLEARYSITGKIPSFWRRIRYWQKGAIVFGVIHIILFISLLLIHEVFYGFGKGVEMGKLEFLILEIPLLFIGDLFSHYFPIRYNVSYFSFLIFGTFAYVLFGAAFGLFIDVIIYTIKVAAKRRT
jgi:hypothetical protein